MAIGWRGATFFGAGLLLGVVSTAALFGTDPTLKSADANGHAPPPAAAVKLASLSQADCSFAPMVGSSGQGDGSVSLQPAGGSGSSVQVQDLLKTGKEAAAAGHARDAELSFLMACRAAKGIEDPNGLPLADAQYQLGRHYADLAGAPNAQHRDELLKRAQALYSASLASYQQRYGPDGERTRFAQEGLNSVQQLLASAGTHVAGGPAEAAPAAPAAPAVAAASAPAPVAAASAPQPVAQARPAAEHKATSPAKAAVEPKPAPPPDATAQAQPERRESTRSEAAALAPDLVPAAPKPEAVRKPPAAAEAAAKPAEPKRDTTARAEPEAEARPAPRPRPLVVAPEPPVERRPPPHRAPVTDSADAAPPSTNVISGPPAAATGDANAPDGQ